MVRLAAAHVAPAWLDRDASLERAANVIDEAADADADIVVFPESFVPGFPYWINLGLPPSHQQELWLRLREHAVDLSADDPLGPVASKAAARGVHVVMGATERAGGSLYNVQILLDRSGSVAGWRRKLVPTLFERTVWAFGDGANLRAWDTDAGRVCGLICWEHIHHLIRHAMAAEEPDLVVAAWPGFAPALGIDAAFPRRVELLSASFALMAQTAVAAVSHPVTQTLLDAVAAAVERPLNDPRPVGGRTAIYDARGSVLAETSSAEGDIVVAEVAPAIGHAAKWVADPVGHSSRSELLRLHVDRRAHRAVSPVDPDEGVEPWTNT